MQMAHRFRFRMTLAYAALIALALLCTGPAASPGMASTVSADPQRLTVTAVEADPTRPNFLFLAYKGYGTQLRFREPNLSLTLVGESTDLEEAPVFDLLVHPTNSSRLLAGTTDGIYFSTDRGGTWNGATTVVGFARRLAYYFQNPSIVYAATGTSIHKSTNGGDSWSEAYATDANIAHLDAVSVSVSPLDPNTILAGGKLPDGTQAVFRSNDGGSSWQLVGTSQSSLTDVKLLANSQGGVYAFYSDGLGIFRSTDPALPFQRVTEELGGVAVNRMEANPLVAGEMAAATDNGVIRSTDGGDTWSEIEMEHLNPNNVSGQFAFRDLSYDRASPQTLYAITDSVATMFQLPASPPPAEPPTVAAPPVDEPPANQPPANNQPPAQNPPATNTPHDDRYFDATGFRIDNDTFWDYFNRRGGLRTFGFPISRTFTFQGFTTQFFQREIMQLAPDGSARTLNLLDPGLMPYTHINGSTFPAPDPSLASQAPVPGSPNYDQLIQQFIQDSSPDSFDGMNVNFYHSFQNTVSLQDAFPDGNGNPDLVGLLNLELWGVPTSRPNRDPANSNFVYLRFQRGIMHYDASNGATQGLLLADYLKSILTGRDLPPDLEDQARNSQFYRQYNPNRPNWVDRPDQLPATDLTNAFEKQ